MELKDQRTKEINMNIIHKDTPHRSPQNYTDLDGNSRTFTEIDMDKKTKISIPDDGTDPKEELRKYRENLIEKILSKYAGYCPTVFIDYTIRGEGKMAIQWNENMLRDQGTSTDRLTQLYTLVSNTEELAANRIPV